MHWLSQRCTEPVPILLGSHYFTIKTLFFLFRRLARLYRHIFCFKATCTLCPSDTKKYHAAQHSYRYSRRKFMLYYYSRKFLSFYIFSSLLSLLFFPSPHYNIMGTTYSGMLCEHILTVNRNTSRIYILMLR